VVALADLDPVTAFSGMRVGISGEFDAAHEVLVEPRERDGQVGAWVLTPMRPRPGTSADAADTSVAVVRGWVPSGQRPTPPPAGTVDVVGVLVADARVPDAAVTAGDPPTLPVVDTGALSAHAGYPVRSGWFALTEMRPPGGGQPLPLQVTELPGADVGLNWRNAAYAIQWVAFAAFAIFFWNRFRRDYVERPVEQETPQ
jgi:cytochrome oxidase assembly protein ShyY1